MATWEEILNQSYNPVNSVRDRHQALMEQRQAENIARMRAANPGFQVGGNMPAMQQGFQRYQQPSPFNTPSGQDDWLKTQFEMANEHLGGFGVQQQPAAQDPTGGMGGMGNANGRNNSSDGPQSNNNNGRDAFGPSGMPSDYSGYDAALAGVAGIPEGFKTGLNAISPNLLGPVANMFQTQTPEMKTLYGELTDMGPIDQNNLPLDPTNTILAGLMNPDESNLKAFAPGPLTDKDVADLMKLDEADISRVMDNAPGVGLGPSVSGPEGYGGGKTMGGGDIGQGPGTGKGGGSSGGNTGGGGGNSNGTGGGGSDGPNSEK